MLEKILPENVIAPVKQFLNMNKVYEIRLRSGRPVIINYGGVFRYLTEKGISENSANSVTVTCKAIDNIIFKASDCSIYAVNEQIKQGFITISGGIRIGLAGEIVPDGKEIRTIKNYNALNIRIPHEVRDCSQTAFNYIVNGNINNSLVISPPGAGKTTFLRDLSRQFSLVSPIVSVFVIDERGEIGAAHNGQPLLDIGGHTDIITNCSKKYGFEQGIRCMRPDIIITDEIASSDDIEAISYAISSGVKVMASTHAYDHIDLSLKAGFDQLIKKRMFNRYIVLSGRRGPGTLEGVYDENFNCLYFP